MDLISWLQFRLSELKKPKIFNFRIICLIILVIFVSSLTGFLAGSFSIYFLIKNFPQQLKNEVFLPSPSEKKENGFQSLSQISQERAIIEVFKKVSPLVVSIIVSKDLPILEEYYYNPFEEFFGPLPFEFRIPQYRQKGVKRQEIGGGTGFIISKDGLILTNKHVVFDPKADYTVLTNDGRKFPAKVLARDPGQDLAIIKIDAPTQFIPVQLGNSDELEIGQTVMAIGNVLGEFRNSISVGVISGLGRKITASGGGMIEVLEDVIQTDAAINKGNSGGPLLNLKGEVIGINTAMVLEAQNIGFAIPINKAKKAIEQVKTLGKIVYPFLGVRYILIDEEIQKEYNLPVNYGAWIKRSREDEEAIFSGSAAEKAGLKEGDIILEFNNEKISQENSLAKIIMKYNPGDRVTLKVLRKGEEKIFEVVLGERSE